MWENDGGTDAFFMNQCTIACVNNKGEGLVRRVDKRDDGENLGEGDADPTVWHIHVARTIMHLKKALVREMTEDKLFNFMIEWCDTPLIPAMGCCYDDCCVIYLDDGPAKQAGFIAALVVTLLSWCFDKYANLHRDMFKSCNSRASQYRLRPSTAQCWRQCVCCQVPRSRAKDVYVRVPHCIKPKVPEDVLARLFKFYRQTFWGNLPVFQCCQAAQAGCPRVLCCERVGPNILLISCLATLTQICP